MNRKSIFFELFYWRRHEIERRSSRTNVKYFYKLIKHSSMIPVETQKLHGSAI